MKPAGSSRLGSNPSGVLLTGLVNVLVGGIESVVSI